MASVGGWDVIVIGAGPAGSVSAMQLARAGHSVLLIDKSAFPRGKVCGSCLHPRGVALLGSFGLGDEPLVRDAPLMTDVELLCGGARARLALPGGRVIARRDLDERLIREAVSSGAEFFSGAAARIGALKDGFREVHVGASIEHALCVLDAAGLGSRLVAPVKSNRFLRARLGAGHVYESGARDLGVGTVRMFCGEGGYVGLVRLGSGETDAAAALDPELVKNSGGVWQAACEIVRSCGADADEVIPQAAWRGAPLLSQAPQTIAAERVFAIGDAAGYAEPFTGEGMTWAMESAIEVMPFAEAAVARWDDSLAVKWNRSHAQTRRQRERLCRATRLLLRSPLMTRAAMQLINSFPRPAHSLIDALQAGGALQTR
ncbi:FAD-dependent oxidoreductase [soil metagenome]